MVIKKICFLAGGYPTPQKPVTCVFYQNLIHEFARKGIECRVIHPFPVNYDTGSYLLKREDILENGIEVVVYRPKTITLGAKKIGRFNTAYITSCFYTISASKLFRKLNWKPDVFYGHFISPAGIIAAKMSVQYGIPAFVAYGESEPWSIQTIGIDRSRKELAPIKGFITVSVKNRNELIKYQISDEDKIAVFPNAINNRHFYKRDKALARKKMGWDLDKFIVAFVGHFNHRKGVLRLEQAVKATPDVYVAYAGSGELIPQSNNILHKGYVSPDIMPWFLSAADIFVLPTLKEGCSNAIIEALACGLPVISSRLEFNEGILNDENSIRVDPKNIEEITKAIKLLKNNIPLRTKMGRDAIKTGNKLNIKVRTQNILNWMESLIEKQ